jgi:hypothetical protein
MKKKLRKELNNYLEKDGFKIDKIIGDRFTTDCKYWELVFTIKKNPKQPTKEQLLEKAKRDYVDGTIVIDAFDKEKETSTGKSHWYDKRIWDNNENCCLYDKGKWAKIIKKPIFKLQDKYMYEGDEFFQIRKHDNWKLTKQTASNKKYFHDEIERFSTKQDALNYVLEEAKERFKDSKYFRFIGYKKRYTISNYNPWFIENDKISNSVYACWNPSEGWIAEPIKEPKLMLGNYEVEIETVKASRMQYEKYGFFEKTIIKCKGGQVTKEEWMEWEKVFIPIVENDSIYSAQMRLGKYDTSKFLNTKSCEIGCIKTISIDQIQAITDRLNKI